jgi:hypothetical protein
MNDKHSDPTQNGWRRIEKVRGTQGMYDKWATQVRVIIPREKKPTHICLTPAAWAELGNPEAVELFDRGQNVGIMNSASINNAQDYYRVANSRGGTKPSKLFYITCHTWLREVRLQPGVYLADMLNGMLVFDTKQKPSNI